jgi:hypothetical protein
LTGGDVVGSGMEEVGVNGLFGFEGLRLVEIIYFFKCNGLGCMEVVGFHNLLWVARKEREDSRS